MIDKELLSFKIMTKKSEQVPQKFLEILQLMLKETKAEFIYLSGGYSDEEYLIHSCMVGYENYESIKNHEDFYSLGINNNEYTLENFRDKKTYLVEEYDPIWDKVLNMVEDDNEFEVLQKIYRFYFENFQHDMICNYIEEETRNNAVLITKEGVSLL